MPSEFRRTTFGRHHDYSTDDNEYAFPDGPYFSYRQDFSDSNRFEGVSYGHSQFTQLLDYESTGSGPAFSVHKTYNPPNITVCIQSETLANALSYLGIGVSRTYNILPFFKYFAGIHTWFMDQTRLAGQFESHWPRYFRELKLFVVHFLLDYAIFHDAEKILPGSVSPAIRGRMQSGKSLLDLDHLERAFDQPERRTAPKYTLPNALKLNDFLIISRVTGLFRQVVDSFGRLNDNRDHSKGQTPEEDGPPWQLVLSVRKYFHDNFLILRYNQTNTTYSDRKPKELSRLRIPTDPRNSWKAGVQVIRGVLRGHIPQTVEQVIFCIMTADAIRTNAKNVSCTKEAFIRDLDRWRDVLKPEEDKRLFEEVIFLLLGEHLDKTPRVHHSDNLYHFQELLQNLLSETGTDEFESDWHGGTRLSVIQARHAEGVWASVDVQPDPVSTPDVDISTHPPEKYKEIWYPHDFTVVELASTVIFCLVIAVLLFLYHPVAHAQATLLIQKITDQSSKLSVVHKRNCILLACYLGLSTHTIENIPFSNDEGYKSKIPRPCCLCGKRVSKSNMARHQKDKHQGTHEPKKEHGCQYCPSNFSRKDNRDAHEKICQIKLGESTPPGLSSSTRDFERGLGTRWPNANQPAILHDTDINQDWSAKNQPTHNSISRPYPYFAWSNVAEVGATIAPATVLSSDGLTPLSQVWAAELNNEPSSEAELLLEQYTIEGHSLVLVPTTPAEPITLVALDGDSLDALLDQPLSDLESEMWAAQSDSIDIDMDMGI